MVAGLAVIGAGAFAAGLRPLDTRIAIDRAIDSPTLTVRYSGATAVLVELRVNGVSMGTREVSGARSSGETNFTLNLAELKDGENEVEVRLFDKSGKLLGSEKTKIAMNDTAKGPVYLTTPKVGQEVKGAVEVTLGFGRQLKEPFVSFFVDKAFKSMSNFPPFSYVWDTTRESNGWHEIEAWAIDQSSATFKTRTIRVYVNNPRGETKRVAASAPGLPPGAPIVKPPVKVKLPVARAAAVKRPPIKAPAVKALPVKALPVKAIGIKAPKVSAIKTPAVKANISAIAPIGTAVQAAVGKPMANPKRGVLGASSGLKPAMSAEMVATGPKFLTPTGTRVAKVKVKPPVKAKGTTKAAGRTPIVKGTRLPETGRFAVLLDGSYVTFDVSPRVDNGVPMTPLRHLLEKGGGKVDWESATKTIRADAEGKKLFLKIGDPNAKVNSLAISLEAAPYLDRSRTIVPLSFLRDALGVNVEYDRETGHVLITTAKKKIG